MPCGCGGHTAVLRVGDLPCLCLLSLLCRLSRSCGFKLLLSLYSGRDIERRTAHYVRRGLILQQKIREHLVFLLALSAGRLPEHIFRVVILRHSVKHGKRHVVGDLVLRRERVYLRFCIMEIVLLIRYVLPERTERWGAAAELPGRADLKIRAAETVVVGRRYELIGLLVEHKSASGRQLRRISGLFLLREQNGVVVPAGGGSGIPGLHILHGRLRKRRGGHSGCLRDPAHRIRYGGRHIRVQPRFQLGSGLLTIGRFQRKRAHQSGLTALAYRGSELSRRHERVIYHTVERARGRVPGKAEIDSRPQ